ncbi:RUS family member 1, partial [Pezoporus wallicus]|uniref:RUS family member 1 n=1 Tax=Pezoporus wallicus TaxID=35540 RepID=UPI00254EDA19
PCHFDYAVFCPNFTQATSVTSNADQQNFNVTVENALTRCLQNQQTWTRLLEEKGGQDPWLPAPLRPRPLPPLAPPLSPSPPPSSPIGPRRLAADVINDVALLLELLAPGWPRAGPALLTLAAAGKCVVGVAGGATRAALAVHQARRDNVAEVAAKDSSQETLVNGLGLLLALLLLPALEGRPWVTWAVMTLLLVTHVGANVGAVGSLRLRSLNRPRLRLALGGALRGGAKEGGGAIAVPTPDEVNPREPLLPGFSTRLRLHLGAPLHRLVKSEAELQKAIECSPEQYLIVLRPSEGWVGVGLRLGTPPRTLVLACAQALLLEELLGAPLPPGAPMGAALSTLRGRLRRCPPGSVPWGVLAESTRLWGSLGPRFLQGTGGGRRDRA